MISLTPAPAPASARSGEQTLYLRSYLMMRTVVGVIGLALPILLVTGDLVLLDGDVLPRGSLSAYYHSGMRDVFVATLGVAAIFLVTYKVMEHNLDNLLSTVAGVAALGVAVFPTNRPGGSDSPPTPLQRELGEGVVAAVHYGGAAVFIACLAVICFLFGVREGRRGRQRAGGTARLSPLFWRRFHWSCALAIVLSVAVIVATRIVGVLDEYSLLVGEVVAVLAFGGSWLAKGLELRHLRH
jgi:hypothetical protein